MKHKCQVQDSQLSIPFSGALYTPLAFCPPPSALGSCLQLLYPWASLPGPLALVQPPGCSWDPCQLEQASLASAWASCNRLRPAASQALGTRCTCWAQPCPGDPGACVPSQRLGMSSEEAWQPEACSWGVRHHPVPQSPWRGICHLCSCHSDTLVWALC